MSGEESTMEFLEFWKHLKFLCCLTETKYHGQGKNRKNKRKNLFMLFFFSAQREVQNHALMSFVDCDGDCMFSQLKN